MTRIALDGETLTGLHRQLFILSEGGTKGRLCLIKSSDSNISSKINGWCRK